MKITMVIPTYNESKNIVTLTTKVIALGIPGLNILFVDDNSPDGTGSIADSLNEKYGDRVQVLHRKEKAGLGKAYIQGLTWALQNNSQVIGMMDADLSHPPEKIPEMLIELNNSDLVIGSRYVEGGALDKNWPFWRKTLSRFGNFYSRTILEISIKDVTGGFKLWRRDALRSIPIEDIKSSGYVFQVEQTYIAFLKGLKISEVPILFSDRQFGKSKMSLRIQLEAAIRVWKLKNIYKDI